AGTETAKSSFSGLLENEKAIQASLKQPPLAEEKPHPLENERGLPNVVGVMFLKTHAISKPKKKQHLEDVVHARARDSENHPAARTQNAPTLVNKMLLSFDMLQNSQHRDTVELGIIEQPIVRNSAPHHLDLARYVRFSKRVHANGSGHSGTRSEKQGVIETSDIKQPVTRTDVR
ncbi:unnamed protein product, partial [marine sediment metagenome]